jgi:carboxyl-terminal processing protease
MGINHKSEEQQDADYEKKLKELLKLIDTVYVDDYDKTQLGDMLAAAAVAATGDRWSYYISAEEYASYLENSNNEYVGIGVTVRLVNEDDEGITVIEVNRGGSAHEAGILPGDMIVSVDGHSAVEMGVDAMSDMIRGKEGTPLTIGILREGKLMEIPMVRKLIEVEVVTYENLDGIGYIKIENFQAHCAEKSIAAIEDLVNQGVKGLIFDLRYNPGGRKSELCEVLDYILPEGPLFRSVDYNGQEFTDYSAGESVLELPMVVMVNQDSYSAAEFFAAAMQEYEWATIVGSQTVGKGNYQQTFPLSDGSAVAISTGHYSTPNGVNLEGVGITPDVEVDVDEDTYIAIYLQSISKEEDAQLQAALEQFSK